MRRISPLLLCAAVVALAACSPAEAPAAKGEGAAAEAALTGFSHPAGKDLFGYYMPTTDIKAGGLRLEHFHIGDEKEFADWEAGQLSATYSPVMFEFADVTSPIETNEMGGEVHAERPRALADAYRIGEDGSVEFVDNHASIGKITFSGKLDLAALASAKSETGTDNPTVLTGTLTVAGQKFENVAFTWFGGD